MDQARTQHPIQDPGTTFRSSHRALAGTGLSLEHAFVITPPRLETGRVGQQVAHGHGFLVTFAENRKVLGHRIVESDESVLHQPHHAGRGGNALRQRGQVEDGLARHGQTLGPHGRKTLSPGEFKHLALSRHPRKHHRAGYFRALDRLVEGALDFSQFSLDQTSLHVSRSVQ